MAVVVHLCTSIGLGWPHCVSTWCWIIRLHLVRIDVLYKDLNTYAGMPTAPRASERGALSGREGMGRGTTDFPSQIVCDLQPARSVM